MSHLTDPDKTLEIEIFVNLQRLAKKARRQDSTKQRTVLGPWCRIICDRSHVMIRAANIAPRVATNFRPALRQNFRPFYRTIHTTSVLTTTTTVPISSRCIAEKNIVRTVIARERRASYATMAAATSFYEFKPKDSTSPHDFSYLTGYAQSYPSYSLI
jgi:hypothetical protein